MRVSRTLTKSTNSPYHYFLLLFTHILLYLSTVQSSARPSYVQAFSVHTQNCRVEAETVESRWAAWGCLLPRWPGGQEVLNSQCCFFTALSCFSAATIHCYACFVYGLQGSACWAQLVGHRLQCVRTDRRAHNGGQLGPTVHCMPTMPLAFANNLMLLCWKTVYRLQLVNK